MGEIPLKNVRRGSTCDMEARDFIYSSAVTSLVLYDLARYT
jgi:hypothetical protein